MGGQHAAQALEARDPRRWRHRSAHLQLAKGRYRHWRNAPSVRARHRRIPNAARTHWHRASGRNQRRGAEPHRGRQLCVYSQRRRGALEAHHPVLRDVWFARAVSRRMESRCVPPLAYRRLRRWSRLTRSVRPRSLGAVQRCQRRVGDNRRGGRESRQAARVDRDVVATGRAVQGAAAQQPARQVWRHSLSARHLRVLPGHRKYPREHRAKPSQPRVPHHRRTRRHGRRQHRWCLGVPWRSIRWLCGLHPESSFALREQSSRSRDHHDLGQRAVAGGSHLGSRGVHPNGSIHRRHRAVLRRRSGGRRSHPTHHAV